MSKYSNPACKIKQEQKQKKINKNQIEDNIVEILHSHLTNKEYIFDYGKELYKDVENDLKEIFGSDAIFCDVKSCVTQVLRNIYGYVYIPISTRQFRGSLSKNKLSYLIKKEHKVGLRTGAFRYLNNCHSGIWVHKSDIDIIQKVANIYKNGDYFCICVKADMHSITSGGKNRQLAYIQNLKERCEKRKKQYKSYAETVAWAKKNFGKIILYPYKDTYRYRNRKSEETTVKTEFSAWKLLILENPHCDFGEYALE